MTMILIRGWSGSGKSTLADSIQDKMYDSNLNVVSMEADDYFLDHDTGKYKFDPTKLKDAHKWCKSRAREDANDPDISHVIVSNTFTQHWEMDAYMRIAEQTGRKLLVVKCEGNYDNVHGVPDGVVQKQKARFEDWPGEIIFNGNLEDVI